MVSFKLMVNVWHVLKVQNMILFFLAALKHVPKIKCWWVINVNVKKDITVMLLEYVWWRNVLKIVHIMKWPSVVYALKDICWTLKLDNVINYQSVPWTVKEWMVGAFVRMAITITRMECALNAQLTRCLMALSVSVWVAMLETMKECARRLSFPPVNRMRCTMKDPKCASVWKVMRW